MREMHNWMHSKWKKSLKTPAQTNWIGDLIMFSDHKPRLLLYVEKNIQIYLITNN